MYKKYEGMELPLTADRVVKDLSLPEDSADEIQVLLDKSFAVARPKVYARKVLVQGHQADSVQVGERLIQSRLVAKNLANVKWAYAYVGTCGVELDALLAQTTDPLDQFCQAQINQRMMRLAVVAARADIMKAEGIKTLNAVNPGSNADWPLSAQVDLFALLGDVKGEIGVTLTDSFLMLPIKSVSGLWYYAEKEYVNCMVCPRKVCENRGAEFDQELFDEIFGGDPDAAEACAGGHE